MLQFVEYLIDVFFSNEQVQKCSKGFAAAVNEFFKIDLAVVDKQNAFMGCSNSFFGFIPFFPAVFSEMDFDGF